MRLGRLNHVGVATPSIEAAVVFWRDVMGARVIRDAFDMPAQGVRVCFVETPGAGGMAGTQVELLEPLGEASPITRFLARSPQGGQHHLAFEVPDIRAARRWFADQGKRVLGEPRIGAHGTLVFFVHPADMGGVLTEIMEAPDAH